MTIIRDGKTIELTDFELYQATREYERNCYSEDVMNYLAEKYGQDAVFSDEEIEIMVDEMAEAHSMVEENNAEYLYDTFEDIIRRDNAREADELAGTTYTCRPGYYEYNVYDNYSGVIVYNINDPGEMVMDWKTKDADNTYKTVMENAADGAIILMHEIYEPSYEAAKRIIPDLEKQGYQFVTISEMAAAKGDKLRPNHPYGSF